MKIIFIVAIILFSFYSNTVQASGQMTVGDIRDICIGKDEATKNACSFYIWGVAEGFSLGENTIIDKTVTKNISLIEKNNKAICMKEGVSKESVEFIVKKAIGEDLMFYPDDRALPAVSFIAAIIAKTFPCNK